MAKKKWMQAAAKRMEKKGTRGAFGDWCREHGFNGATSECIAYALAHGSTTTKQRANFAQRAKKASRKRKRGQRK